MTPERTSPDRPKLKILFLCTGNSCRSQMAEGWCRHLKGDRIQAYSAGVETHGLNPRAVRVMDEVSIGLSSHRAKHLDELSDIRFDYVITVCDRAHESCPLFPGHTVRIHAAFDDPPRLTRDARTDEEALPVYRRVRDEIRSFIETLPEALPPKTTASLLQTSEGTPGTEARPTMSGGVVGPPSAAGARGSQEPFFGENRSSPIPKE